MKPPKDEIFRLTDPEIDQGAGVLVFIIVVLVGFGIISLATASSPWLFIIVGSIVLVCGIIPSLTLRKSSRRKVFLRIPRNGTSGVTLQLVIGHEVKLDLSEGFTLRKYYQEYIDIEPHAASLNPHLPDPTPDYYAWIIIFTPEGKPVLSLSETLLQKYSSIAGFQEIRTDMDAYNNPCEWSYKTHQLFSIIHSLEAPSLVNQALS